MVSNSYPLNEKRVEPTREFFFYKLAIHLNSLFISLATATILRVWTFMLQPPAVSLHLPQGLAQGAACITRQGPSVKSKVRGIVPAQQKHTSRDHTSSI
jgi:hypothetical protein